MNGGAWSITPFDERDRSAVVQLYLDSFDDPTRAETRARSLAEFEDHLLPERCVVARDGAGQVIGFGQFVLFHERPTLHHRMQIQSIWAALPQHRERSVSRFRALHGWREITEGTLEILLHAPRARPRPALHDAYFTAVAVAPDHRHRGIGRALARARIEMARYAGAGRIYRTDGPASPSAALYESLGFTATLEMSPYYADGSAARDMYLELGDAATGPRVGHYVTTVALPYDAPLGWLSAAGYLLILPLFLIHGPGGGAALATAGVVGAGALVMAHLTRTVDQRGPGEIIVDDEGLQQHFRDEDGPSVRFPALEHLQFHRAGRGPTSDGSVQDHFMLRCKGPGGSQFFGPLHPGELSGLIAEIDLRSGLACAPSPRAGERGMEAKFWMMMPPFAFASVMLAGWSPHPAIRIAGLFLAFAVTGSRLYLLAAFAGDREQTWRRFAVCLALAAAGLLFVMGLPGSPIRH